MDPVMLALEADLEWKFQTAQAINRGDDECGRYLVENRQRLLPRMMLTQQKYGGEVDLIIHKFVQGVHERHISGKEIT